MNKLTTMAFLGIALLFAMPPGANAQLKTWDGGGNPDGRWSTGTNWNLDTAPISAIELQIALSSTANTTTIMDLDSIGSPLQLNRLTLNNTATAGFKINKGSTTPGAMRFVDNGGTLPQIVVNGASGVRIAIATDIEFAANTTVNIATASTGVVSEIGFMGKLSGSGNISFTNDMTGKDALITSSNNTLTGTVNIGIRQLYLGGFNALGRGATVNINTTGPSSGFSTAPATDAFYSFTGGQAYSQQFAALSSIGGSITIGNTTNAATVAAGFNNANTDVASSFLSNLTTSYFAKVGTGTITYTANSTGFRGVYSIRGGTFDITGDSASPGGFTNATPSTTYSSAEVFAGAILRQTVIGTDASGRFADSGNISVAGGNVHLDGTGLGDSGGIGYTDTANALIPRSGQSTIRVVGSTVRGAGLAFSGLTTPSATATLFFQSNSLGIASVDTVGAGNVNFAAAPTTVGGGGNFAATNTSIIASATASSTGAGTPDTFAGYDPVNGVRAITNYAATFGTVATDNVSPAGDAQGNSFVSGIANSMRVINASKVTLTASSTLTSGALLVPGSANIFGSGVLAFGSAGNATAYITIGGSTTIQGPTISSANLSKNGPGVLTLNTNDPSNPSPATARAYTLTAPNPVVAVNAGQLTIQSGTVGTSTALSSANVLTYQVSKDAIFNVPNGLAIDDFKALQGLGTVTGAVTVSGSGVIRPSSLGGPSASLASPGVLTLNGSTTTFGSGGTYEWYVNSVLGGDYTQSKIVSNATLNITATSGTPFNIKVTPLQLSNATGGPMYDVEANASYNWVIASFSGITNTGGITDINGVPNNIVVSPYNSSDFAGSNLSVKIIGNDMVLVVTPVPEPVTLLGIAAAGLGMTRWIRRRWKTGAIACVSGVS